MFNLLLVNNNVFSKDGLYGVFYLLCPLFVVTQLYLSFSVFLGFFEVEDG